METSLHSTVDELVRPLSQPPAPLPSLEAGVGWGGGTKAPALSSHSAGSLGHQPSLRDPHLCRSPHIMEDTFVTHSLHRKLQGRVRAAWGGVGVGRGPLVHFLLKVATAHPVCP